MKHLNRLNNIVMPGLDPGIQKAARRASGLDRRVKPGDGSFSMLLH